MKRDLLAIVVIAFMACGIIVALSDTNTVIKTGIVIKTRPVIYVTMETNHVYTLWVREKMTDPWEVFPLMEHFTCTNTPKRVVMEGDEGATTGFFWLQVDGQPYQAPATTTNAVGGVPPFPK